MAVSEKVVTDKNMSKYVMWGIDGIFMKFLADFRRNCDSIAKNKIHH